MQFLKYFFLIVLISLLAKISFAERQYALINDDDGYTFVRNGMGMSFPVIDTIHNDQFFLFEKNIQNDWFKIWLSNGSGTTGFVHKSRIQPIDSIEISRLNSSFKRIFTKHQSLGEDFSAICCTTDSSEMIHEHYIKTGYSVLRYSEEYFYPSLPVFAATFCSNSDSDLFLLFVHSLWAHSGSASETPSEILTKCLLCDTQLVLSAISQLNDLDQKIFLYEQLEFGLMSVDKNQFENVQALKEVLLKQKKQP